MPVKSLPHKSDESPLLCRHASAQHNDHQSQVSGAQHSQPSVYHHRRRRFSRDRNRPLRLQARVPGAGFRRPVRCHSVRPELERTAAEPKAPRLADVRCVDVIPAAAQRDIQVRPLLRSRVCVVGRISFWRSGMRTIEGTIEWHVAYLMPFNGALA
jgi:hypothetical protein